MHRQLRRTAIVSTSAAMLLGIAGIQAGIAQAATLGTSTPSPVLISHQTSQPVSMSIAHMKLATPLAISSAPRPADSGNDNGNANQDNANQDNANQNSKDKKSKDKKSKDKKSTANKESKAKESKAKESKAKESKARESKDKESKDKESKDKESGSTSLSRMPVL